MHGTINVKLYNTYIIHNIVSECKFMQQYDGRIMLVQYTVFFSMQTNGKILRHQLGRNEKSNNPT